MRASLKGWGRRLARPQCQAGALTSDVLAVIRITAVQPRRPAPPSRPRHRNAGAGRRARPRRRGPGGGAVRRGVASFRGGGPTWGDVQRWEDGSGRITVIRSKTDVEAQGAVMAITPAAMRP